MTTFTDALAEHDHRAVIGHLSEFERLRALLDALPGIVVLAADPLSGASGVVRAALAVSPHPAVYADARGAQDATDLAICIADAAIAALRPEANGWWRGTAPTGDPAGARLRRAVVDADDLRTATGSGERLLRIALGLTATLAPEPVVIAIDHLDAAVAAAPDPLGTLRATAQEDAGLNLLLVGRTDGPVAAALHDPGHPLYRGGQLRRAPASRFVDDLDVAPAVHAPPEVIAVAADLASGVPAHVWSSVDLAAGRPEMRASDRALAGWQALQRVAAAASARQFDVLRAVHPIAQQVLAAMAAGRGPYTLAFNDGRIRAALAALQQVGVVWQPGRRDWAIADPLLAAWAGEHAHAALRRRD